MIIYLHGFDSTSPGNHEKVLQLQFIDEDVRFINYSTLHPKHDMQHLLKEVSKVIEQSGDKNALICGVGLGAYWSERIGFLCGIKQVMFNPNLHPEKTMQGRIDRPEEYEDIATKCVEKFREKNKLRCMVVLSKEDEIHDNSKSAAELEPYYQVTWDDTQTHKFKKISQHLQAMKAFKQA
ncbi:alpha/beta hydrolase YcfP [Vibrio agarivorans]|uniref:alpha/beta hydrolase YcfP n=1 Tax=Vibrio agarivorans TaxID=153622 RepID=UPI00222EB480|nr:alpha/beta hydrolase YcfP [Vibrio agarivorans]MDN3663683.1 alpha/beta hydrolase YcfP [Vibrio agarivorans]